jgi:hypothetical protein
MQQAKGDFVSIEELILRAAVSGPSPTVDQVVGWHKADLLTRPIVLPRSKGEGSGKRSVYPVHTIQQLRALLALHAKNRHFDDIGWGLWRQGYVVHDRYVRERLLKAADELQALRLAFTNADTAPDDEQADADKVANTAIARFVGTHRPVTSDVRANLFEALLRTLAGANAPSEEKDLRAFTPILAMSPGAAALTSGAKRLRRVHSMMLQTDYHDLVNSASSGDLSSVRAKIHKMVNRVGLRGARPRGRRPTSDRYLFQNPWHPIMVLVFLVFEKHNATSDILGELFREQSRHW